MNEANKAKMRLNIAKAHTCPRCVVTYSDGRTCKLVAMRINPGTTPAEYTKHCKIHGGRKELQAIYRREAEAAARNELTGITSSIHTILAPTPDDKHDKLAPILDGKSTHDEHDSSLPLESSPSDSNPKATGGVVSINQPLPVYREVYREGDSPTGGSLEKSGSEKYNLGNFNDGPDEDLQYAFHDRSLAKGFARKLHHQGALSLNEELALVKTLIQEEMKHMVSGRVNPTVWKNLDKMLARADKIINTIVKLEETKKILYTRESMKMDLMKVLNCIRKWLPEEDRRRGLASDLVRLVGPSLSSPGDVVMTRETFKRG